MAKDNTKNTIFRLSAMAMLAALSVAGTAVLHLPILPAAPFLEYDPADIFILLAGLFFGWQSGLLVLLAAAGAQALTVSAASGLYGFAMHIAATGALLLTACLLREKLLKKNVWLPLCLLLGCLAMTAVMVPANLLITPLFMGAPRQAVVDLLLPAIIPFNAIKSVINSAVAFPVYVALSAAFVRTPFKDAMRLFKNK
jgi:riboflavin transporter FmnP